jgi:CheY-like chemotaxis protein
MLEHLRNDPATKDIPVIMLTARCEPQDIAAGSAHGISDYVTKPFEFADLMEKIKTVLKNKCFG